MKGFRRNPHAFFSFVSITAIGSTLVLSAAPKALSAPSNDNEIARQRALPKEKPEELTLAIAIAKATKNNPTLYSRRLQQELNEMNFEAAWQTMYMPTVGLTVGAGSQHTLTQLKGSSAHMADPTHDGRQSLAHGQPTSSMGLTIGQFTLFNFWRDSDRYEQAKLTFDRSKQSLREVERQVRFEVINAVFNFKTQQDLLDIAQRSVDSAQAIYELVKSRIPLSKATENDLSSAEVDLLNAKNALISAQTSYNQSLWALNLVLGDTIDHPYSVKASIRYIKFKMALDDVIRLFKENAPSVKQAKVDLDQARLSLRIAQKDALPLPTVSFSGITIGHQFGLTNSTQVRETSGASQSGNLDVSATVSLTVPLIGGGGLFGYRTLRASEIQVESAELGLRNAANQGESTVRDQYTQIIQLESTIENNEKLFKESLKVFEGALQSLQSRSTLNRLDLKDAIRQLRDAEQQFTSSVLSHYRLKLSLAQAIAVDKFPEENL